MAVKNPVKAGTADLQSHHLQSWDTVTRVYLKVTAPLLPANTSLELRQHRAVIFIDWVFNIISCTQTQEKNSISDLIAE